MSSRVRTPSILPMYEAHIPIVTARCDNNAK
jgi:hypothetical protein